MQESLIRDRIILGIADQATRKILLQKRDLKPHNTIDIHRSVGMTATLMDAMGNEPSIHKIGKTNKTGKQKASDPKQKHQWLNECKFCGRAHKWRKEDCPAYGKQCNKCGKENHFAYCCRQRKEGRKKKIHKVDTESSDSQSDTNTESVSCIKIHAAGT